MLTNFNHLPYCILTRVRSCTRSSQQAQLPEHRPMDRSGPPHTPTLATRPTQSVNSQRHTITATSHTITKRQIHSTPHTTTKRQNHSDAMCNFTNYPQIWNYFNEFVKIKELHYVIIICIVVTLKFYIT